jgi:hypothetical protein
MNSAANQDAPFYDVVVIGGALSGAATATLDSRGAHHLHHDGMENIMQPREIRAVRNRYQPDNHRTNVAQNSS